jgi:hypothetical protein
MDESNVTAMRGLECYRYDIQVDYSGLGVQYLIIT